MTVLRNPKITDLTWSADFKLFDVTGEGFGDSRTAVDVIKLNDTVADKVPNWTNLKITFQNPEPSTFKSGTIVKVSLYLDGDKTNSEGDQLGGTGQILPLHVFWTCNAGSRRSASLPRPMFGSRDMTWASQLTPLIPFRVFSRVSRAPFLKPSVHLLFLHWPNKAERKRPNNLETHILVCHFRQSWTRPPNLFCTRATKLKSKQILIAKSV